MIYLSWLHKNYCFLLIVWPYIWKRLNIFGFPSVLVIIIINIFFSYKQICITLRFLFTQTYIHPNGKLNGDKSIVSLLDKNNRVRPTKIGSPCACSIMQDSAAIKSCFSQFVALQLMHSLCRFTSQTRPRRKSKPLSTCIVFPKICFDNKAA